MQGIRWRIVFPAWLAISCAHGITKRLADDRTTCPTIANESPTWVGQFCIYSTRGLSVKWIELCWYSKDNPVLQDDWWSYGPWRPAKTDAQTLEKGVFYVPILPRFTSAKTPLAHTWNTARLPRQRAIAFANSHDCPARHYCAQTVDEDLDAYITCRPTNPPRTAAAEEAALSTPAVLVFDVTDPRRYSQVDPTRTLFPLRWDPDDADADDWMVDVDGRRLSPGSDDDGASSSGTSTAVTSIYDAPYH